MCCDLLSCLLVFFNDTREDWLKQVRFEPWRGAVFALLCLLRILANTILVMIAPFFPIEVSEGTCWRGVCDVYVFDVDRWRMNFA